jgi:hypothetical protein
MIDCFHCEILPMDISSFDDLLHAARMQPEPQRLLFVFAAVWNCPTTPPPPSARALKPGRAARWCR